MSLTRSDIRILSDLYLYAAAPPSAIGSRTDTNPKYVSQRLAVLKEDGLVAREQGGVWRLTFAGWRAVQTLIADEEIEIDVSLSRDVSSGR